MEEVVNCFSLARCFNNVLVVKLESRDSIIPSIYRFNCPPEKSAVLCVKIVKKCFLTVPNQRNNLISLKLFTTARLLDCFALRNREIIIALANSAMGRSSLQ